MRIYNFVVQAAISNPFSHQKMPGPLRAAKCEAGRKFYVEIILTKYIFTSYMQDRWRLGQLSLHTSVNVVLGNLTAIDR